MRVAIGVSYDGSGFDGWQSQPSRNTVQDKLERALGAIACAPVRIAGAGRTDAGVHATAQVAHFDTSADREVQAWVRGTNTHLPDSVAVQWAVPVEDDFHARFSARGRSYRYLLYNHPVRPSVFAGRCGWYHGRLDEGAMAQALEAVVGEHDYSAFRAAECQAKTPVRTIDKASVARSGDWICFEFTANAFLHHMVRNLVGCLVYVGAGRHPPSWMEQVLRSRDRKLAAPTFASGGLYLCGVRYDPQWSLPGFPDQLPFLRQGATS